MWRFRIEALADPQSLSRILDAFAQRSIVPARVAAEHRRNLVSCEIEVTDLAWPQVEIIAEKLRAGVLVSSVTVECEAAIGIDKMRHAGDVSDQAA